MPIQMHKDSVRTSAFWRSALGISVVNAKVYIGQVVIRPYGNASYPSCTGYDLQNLYQHLRSSKHFRNSVIYSITCMMHVLCQVRTWILTGFSITFLTEFFSFHSSYLHSTVHSPPAALACEAVHLSATMDVAQTGMISSFIETENVSLLWCVILWSQHRENALFLPKPASIGYGCICTTHM